MKEISQLAVWGILDVQFKKSAEPVAHIDNLGGKRSLGSSTGEDANVFSRKYYYSPIKQMFIDII